MVCPKCMTLMSFCSLFDPLFSFTLPERAHTEVQGKKLSGNLSDVILNLPHHFADIIFVYSVHHLCEVVICHADIKSHVGSISLIWR